MRRKKGGEEKEAMVALVVFVMATLAVKNCCTQKVRLAITFSKIRLDIVFKIYFVAYLI